MGRRWRLGREVCSCFVDGLGMCSLFPRRMSCKAGIEPLPIGRDKLTDEGYLVPGRQSPLTGTVLLRPYVAPLSVSGRSSYSFQTFSSTSRGDLMARLLFVRPSSDPNCETQDRVLVDTSSLSALTQYQNRIYLFTCISTVGDSLVISYIYKAFWGLITEVIAANVTTLYLKRSRHRRVCQPHRAPWLALRSMVSRFKMMPYL
jgi:hypothetical protein